MIKAPQAGRLKWVPGSKPDSQWRNHFTYSVAGLCVLLGIETVLASRGATAIQQAAQAVVLVSLSAIYFIVVIVGVLFLVARRDGVSPTRLARDGGLSMVFNILAFSALYRTYGITDGTIDCKPPQADAIDALYFSMVTFSTLGYGDFRPCSATRPWASSQAILGNLHLAVLVAAAFLVAGQKARTPKSGSRSQKPRRKAPRSPRARRRRP